MPVIEMELNLNLLKYFYEAVNEKSITKAAEKLYITQPALTKAIKELENQLNSKLLIRCQKGVIPTNQGKILYNHIENIFKEINTTKDIIERNNNPTDLYIGTTTSNYFNIITKILIKFKELYPDIRVNIVFNNINVLEDMKKSEKLDILIKEKNEGMIDFEIIDTLELEKVFVAAKKYYPELEGKHLKIEKLLKDYPLIIMSDNSPGRKSFDNFLKEKNIVYKPAYEFNSYDLCKKMVNEGIGIGIENPVDYNNDEYIIIDTDKLPKRYFEIGYINNSNNKLIEKFISLYKNI